MEIHEHQEINEDHEVLFGACYYERKKHVIDCNVFVFSKRFGAN